MTTLFLIDGERQTGKSTLAQWLTDYGIETGKPVVTLRPEALPGGVCYEHHNTASSESLAILLNLKGKIETYKALNQKLYDNPTPEARIELYKALAVILTIFPQTVMCNQGFIIVDGGIIQLKREMAKHPELMMEYADELRNVWLRMNNAAQQKHVKSISVVLAKIQNGNAETDNIVKWINDKSNMRGRSVPAFYPEQLRCEMGECGVFYSCRTPARHQRGSLPETLIGKYASAYLHYRESDLAEEELETTGVVECAEQLLRLI